MSKDILITDSLFVGPAHEKRLIDSGFSVTRLDKPCASEAELIEAIKGKVGYILGGIEKVTDPVIRSGDRLKAIAFTGSGYSEFIPAHKLATDAGIVITAAKGANKNSVAEYTMALLLMLARRIPLLSYKDGKSFYISKEFSSQTVGVIGFGNIGQTVAEKCQLLGFKVLIASHQSSLDSARYEFVSLPELVQRSDLVTVHVNKEHGQNVLSADLIDNLKNGASIINAAFPEAVDEAAMFQRILKKEIFAAFDAPPHKLPANLPVGHFIASNSQTAFNTEEANNHISEIVVTSLLNVLAGKDDQYRVN